MNGMPGRPDRCFSCRTWYPSEDQLESELNVSRITRIKDLTEQTTASAGANARNRETFSQISVVQSVEEFGTELRRKALTNFRVLEDRGIPAFVGRPNYRAPVGIAGAEWRIRGVAFRVSYIASWNDKRCGVEPFIDGVRRANIRVGDLVRPVA